MVRLQSFRSSQILCLCFLQLSDFAGWFSVFYVTDIDGNKIGDKGTVSYIKTVSNIMF